MFISKLCGPAILYIGFSLIQIIIDTIKNNYENALIKFIIMIVLTILLNILCNIGFSVISWFLVFIPIIMMTIMSTLTLRIFGLEPDSETIRSNVRNISNNMDSSGNYYGQYDYNNITSVDTIERIDRDEVRKDLYTKVEYNYNLNSESEDLYDLSNNPSKYYLIDSLLNQHGDNFFINKIVNSGLYKQLFNKQLFNNGSSISSNNYSTNSVDSYLTNLKNNNMKISLSKDVTPDAPYSYANSQEIINDGFFIYKRQFYNKFVKENPNKNSEDIDKLIENEWNSLSNEDQEIYNNRASGTSSKSSYNPNDLTAYRSPLVSLSYKKNREDTSYWAAQCPPGEIKNNDGSCIRNDIYNDNNPTTVRLIT
jgi:hypothetical protein